MNFSKYKFTLDYHSHKSQVSLAIMLGDTKTRLYIILTDGGTPCLIEDGCRAVFMATKSDGTHLVNNCIIENNSTIRYDFTANTASAVGKVDCEIRLYDSEGKVLTSPRFIMVVDPRVVYDNDVISESEATALDNIIINENARIEAENARVEAEKAREAKVADAINTAIDKVEYRGTELSTEEASLSLVPSDLSLKGSSFTIAGMTDYIDGNTGDSFWFPNENVDEAGFIINLGKVCNVGKVQLYINRNYWDTIFSVFASSDGATFEEVDTITVPAMFTGYTGTYRFEVNKETQFIKISISQADNAVIDAEDDVIVDKGFTNGRLSVVGVKVFEQTLEGEYVIKQVNGIENVFNTLDKDLLMEIPESAQEAEEGAKKALSELNQKAGKVGGYAVLEEIEGEEYPKIPSIYLNQVDIKEYKKITDESQLETIDAQKHDVAILVEPEYTSDDEGNLVPTGELVITKSWLLYDIAEDGTREWIKYGLSYATNAGYSTYANNAGNAQKVNGLVINNMSEADYNALVDKTGIYFVSIEE